MTDARGQAGRLQWECIDNPALKLDDETLQV